MGRLPVRTLSVPEVVQARNCPNRRVGPCLPVMKIADSLNVGVGTAGFVSSSHLVRRLGRDSIGAGTAASTATRDIRFLVHGCLHSEGKPIWQLLQRMIGTYTVTVPLLVAILRRTVEKGCDFGHAGSSTRVRSRVGHMALSSEVFANLIAN